MTPPKVEPAVARSPTVPRDQFGFTQDQRHAVIMSLHPRAKAAEEVAVEDGAVRGWSRPVAPAALGLTLRIEDNPTATENETDDASGGKWKNKNKRRRR